MGIRSYLGVWKEDEDGEGDGRSEAAKEEVATDDDDDVARSYAIFSCSRSCCAALFVLLLVGASKGAGYK